MVNRDNNLFEIATLSNVFYVVIIGIHNESSSAVTYSFDSFTSFAAVKLTTTELLKKAICFHLSCGNSLQH